MSPMLPPQFADLERFAPRWSLPSEAERWERRHSSSMEEMRALYDAVFGRYDDALAYCDQFELDQLPGEARNLLYLLLSFVMVSFPVEVWNGPRIPDSGDASLERVGSPAV
jgi:hypothetical protein